MNAGRWLVSINGGRNPQWAHNGRELFFQGPRDEMMVVTYTGGASFAAGTPTALFTAPPQWAGTGGDIYGVIYDVHPDDQRFLVASQAIAGADSEEAPGPTVILVNNFFTELRTRVP